MQNGLPEDIPRWAQALVTLGVPAGIFIWARWSGRAYVREVVREETTEMTRTLNEVNDHVQYIRGRFDEMDNQR